MKASPHHHPQASLQKQERQQLLVKWNATKVDYPSDICLHHLFETQVNKTPDAVAVVFEDQQLTYRELNDRANQLAHYLKSLGVKTESFVAICMERSLEMVVALYGTIKAGAAYVPTDPTYPRDRLEFMLQDANAPVLLTQEKLRAKLPPHQGRVVCLDSEWPAIGCESTAAPKSNVTAENLAYMIYTSGSTGKPKGAMNTHRGICNRLLWMQNAYRLVADDRVMQKTPFSFDVSVWEFFWPLLAGARLIVARPEGHRDSAYLAELINAQQITTLHFVPSMLQVFLRQLGIEMCRSLRRVICSGEALPHELQQAFFKHLPFAELHNLYGPTEAAVDVTFWQCQPDSKLQIVPIGRPIANIQIYILDPQLQPVLVGAEGELHIGGIGLARGYHNRPELTAEKFIPNPFGTEPGARMYKTGDLARYLPDGNIEYLGRLDHQVKIRGFRIELGEIEAVLGQHPAVGETVVVAREDSPGDKRIVAYLVPKAETTSTISELHAYLKQKLPDYMVPSAFVTLKELPLSPNGKIDRKALPAPNQSRPQLKDEYVKAQTEPEKMLAEIWSEVLEVQPVGIHDNFFELGGDSIRVIQILARAQEQGLRLSLEQFFKEQTIHKLCRLLETNTVQATEASKVRPFEMVAPQDRGRLPAGLEDAYPLVALQEGMHYHCELNPESAVFHDTHSFQIFAAFDQLKLEAALQQLVARHAPLRTSFDFTNYSDPLQLVHKEVKVAFNVEDLRDLAPEAQKQALLNWFAMEKKRPFKWNEARLVRFHVQVYGEQRFQFIVSFHHIIFDGWSLATLLTQVFQDYFSMLNGTRPAAAPLRSSYRDYVTLEKKATALEEARQFWSDKLTDPPISLLSRWPKSMCQGGPEQVRGPEHIISPEVFAGLKRLAQTAGVPVRVVLHAAHLKVMSLAYGKSDVLSGLVTNGRPEDLDAEQLVGLFLNSVPMRLKLEGGTWLDLCRQTFLAEQELIPHRRFPMAEAQKLAGGKPLFETVFDFVNFHVYRRLDGYPNCRFKEGHYFEANNFALSTTFMLDSTSTTLEFHFDYDPNQLPEEQIAELCGYYLSTLAAMAADPTARYEKFSPLSAAERKKLLTDWNSTEVAFPREVCVHQLFQTQATRTPEAPALVFEGQRLSYGELNRRANQLAHHLQSLDAGPEKRVAICVERSAEMIIGLLGILKSGAAYVALDPVFPAERLAYMIEDSQAMLVITQQKLVASLPGARCVALDVFDWNVQNADSDPQSGVTAKDLAYVIYTSGSTGRPKGVAIEHRQLVNYVLGILQRMDFPSGANFATVSTIAADLGNTVVFPSLCCGGCLHVISQDRASDAAGFADYCEQHRIDCLKIVPSHLAALLSSPNPRRAMPLKCLILGGEASRCEWVAGLQKPAPDCTIFNHYGPTETTVGVLTYRVGKEMPLTSSGTLPLGRPLPNSQIYILDERMQPVPVGVAGELYIGGDGVGRGYLNRPELTAERFVPNPFSAEPNARLYRTGDQARYLVDGNIEFLGRIDQQVKIRGFRIELGEIEMAISQLPGVRAAVVVAREDQPDNKQLVAYVVPRQSAKTLLTGDKPYKLPNNLFVAHLNKNETDYIYKEIFELQAYLRHGITIKDGDVVFDVGMNIGLFTVFVNQICQQAHVYGFEPNPVVHRIASANAKVHGFDVNVFQCGLSNEDTTAELTFFEGFSLLSGFHTDADKEKAVVKNYMINQQKTGQDDLTELIANADELLKDRFKARTFQAQLRTLSSLMADEKIRRIDMLKINVEKSELQVLQGIRDEDWPKIQQIVLEVDVKENLDTIIGLLEKHGFEYVVEQDALLEKTELCYIYAIRPSAERRLIREQAPGAHVRPLPMVTDVPLSLTDLKRDLRQRLPDYMVPARFVMLDALPLTPNGKIDRRALPAPEESAAANENFVAPRNPTEQVIANIWAEVLKVKQVGVHDNFFEVGGHSLLAVRLFSQIKKLTGKDLPLVTLFQAPTIEQLAAILNQEGWETPWASLVPIKPGGSKPPFYCVHGIGGSILEYLDLAKHVEADQPFYGLQAIGLDGKRPMQNLTLEQMAAQYVEEIRAFQSHGPYYLGGSSFGGLVAYEMAQQLVAQGEQVALLAFFDANAPGYPRLLPTTTAWQQKWNWWRDRVQLHWGNLQASSGREKLAYVREKAQRWKKQMRWKRQHLWDQARERVGRVFWPAAIKQARVVGYRAATGYTPKPYPGQATLFRATEQPRGIYPDSMLGWEELVQGGLKIYSTPGHHGAIVREPRSRVLAQQLTYALHDALAAESTLRPFTTDESEARVVK